MICGGGEGEGVDGGGGRREEEGEGGGRGSRGVGGRRQKTISVLRSVASCGEGVEGQEVGGEGRRGVEGQEVAGG